MPTLNTFLTFFGASVLLALSPGPDNVFVLLHSAVHGRRAGLLVVLGLYLPSLPDALVFDDAIISTGQIFAEYGNPIALNHEKPERRAGSRKRPVSANVATQTTGRLRNPAR